MRKVEAPRANSLVHTHIALFTWARAALTLSSLEWGLEEDAAHGCLTLLTQPTTPSSARTCFWVLAMYIECEKISDLLRFPTAPPPPVSPVGCVGRPGPSSGRTGLLGGRGRLLPSLGLCILMNTRE